MRTSAIVLALVMLTGVALAGCAEEETTQPYVQVSVQLKWYHQAQFAGFYAADGNAAESSAKAGNKWRVYFTPDCDGEWRFNASFRMGVNIAIKPEPEAGAPTAFDGASGTFRVAKSDKKAPDFRAKGLLQYVGEHYLKHAGNGEYYIKGGADSPENFLAYAGFDNTTPNPQRPNWFHDYDGHRNIGGLETRIGTRGAERPSSERSTTWPRKGSTRSTSCL